MLMKNWFKLLKEKCKKIDQKQSPESLIKIMCIDDKDFNCEIIEGRIYYILDIEYHEDGSESYKILDEFYDEVWVDSRKFIKIENQGVIFIKKRTLFITLIIFILFTFPINAYKLQKYGWSSTNIPIKYDLNSSYKPIIEKSIKAWNDSHPSINFY